jgi:hypothetical protein
MQPNSPYINRFLQPDSIIPNPANPQSLNRFAYVLNNPIRFNDPTGHVCSDPEDPTPTCYGSGTTRVGNRMIQGNGTELGSARNTTSGGNNGNGGRSSPGNNDESIFSNLSAILDHLAWTYIPSAIGVHGNLTWNFGGGIEGNYTPIELMLLANWRSGEISLMVSMEGSGMLTIPDLVGVSLNGGVTKVYGASSNIELTGWSNFSGWSISAGEGLNLGISRNYGKGKCQPPKVSTTHK